MLQAAYKNRRFGGMNQTAAMTFRKTTLTKGQRHQPTL
jgi:hypothetical protein